MNNRQRFFIALLTSIAIFLGLTAIKGLHSKPLECYLYTIESQDKTYYTNDVTDMKGMVTFIDSNGKLKMIKGNVVITYEGCSVDKKELDKPVGM